ncbi:hypothetical protein AOLI_G00258250 [Acnodon oligacanthus]
MEQETQAMEEQFNYRLQRHNERLKKVIDLEVQELGKTVLDSHSVVHTPGDHRQSQMTITSNSLSTVPLKPPIKLEFPRYGGYGEKQDPLVFIEKCEEFLAARPLSDLEVLAALTALLSGRAKAWWQAEKKAVRTWAQFKGIFLRSFLSEDYEAEVERRLRDRQQGPQENIRDFAFQYRALCLCWREGMSEKDLLQAILRNCNPQLASILQGTVKTVDELVRVGTLVERDLSAIRGYWSQAQTDTMGSKSPASKANRKGPAQNSVHSSAFQPAPPPGNTDSPSPDKRWRGFCLYGHQHHIFDARTAKGVMDLTCHLQEHHIRHPFYVMDNEVLAFPITAGLNFLQTYGLTINFSNNTYCLPYGTATTFGTPNSSDPKHPRTVNMHLYLAQ